MMSGHTVKVISMFQQLLDSSHSGSCFCTGQHIIAKIFSVFFASICLWTSHCYTHSMNRIWLPLNTFFTAAAGTVLEQSASLFFFSFVLGTLNEFTTCICLFPVYTWVYVCISVYTQVYICLCYWVGSSIFLVNLLFFRRLLSLKNIVFSFYF